MRAACAPDKNKCEEFLRWRFPAFNEAIVYITIDILLLDYPTRRKRKWTGRGEGLPYLARIRRELGGV
jgi:hypothetical protein